MNDAQEKIVFIMEDDPFISRMYERIFRKSGISTAIWDNGMVGLEELKMLPSKPSVILLDIMMPKLSGMDVLREIKNDPSLCSIPIIILTNLSGKEDAEEALRLGATDYMVKSAHDPAEILQKVLTLVGKI